MSCESAAVYIRCGRLCTGGHCAAVGVFKRRVIPVLSQSAQIKVMPHPTRSSRRRQHRGALRFAEKVAFAVVRAGRAPVSTSGAAAGGHCAAVGVSNRQLLSTIVPKRSEQRDVAPQKSSRWRQQPGALRLQTSHFRKCRICESAAAYIKCVLRCTGGQGAAVRAFMCWLKLRPEPNCSQQGDAAP
jgi:hypothetical protein